VKGALARDGDPPSPIDDPRRYEPGATVGCRLPHAVVDGGRSTLDLVATSRLTVLSFGAHEVWADAISMFDIPLRHVRVGIDTRAEGYDERYGIDDGALLVRPDQHIAWRSDTSAGATNLGSALAMILRGPGT
jgi:2,4-dichlorophenol 6-monooxygenase